MIKLITTYIEFVTPYRVISIKNTKDKWIRPLLKYNGKESKDISLCIIDESSILIYYWSDLVSRKFDVYDVLSKDSIKKISPKLQNKINKALEAEENDRKEKFKGDFEKLPKTWDSAEHDVYVNKKLKLGLRAKKVTFTNGNRLFIPFYDVDNPTELIGCQIRQGESKKYAVKGSIFRKGIATVQNGIYDEDYNTTTVLLSESYTTALEIAEACPKHKVICTAGLNNIKNVAIAYNTNPEYLLIVVADKTKRNSPSIALDDTLKFLNDIGIPYIQLPKMTRHTSDMTDFNDYALKFGKRAVAKLINESVNVHLPQIPQVMKEIENGFEILNTITGLTYNVTYLEVGNRNSIVANTAYWRLFDKLYVDLDSNKVIEMFQMEARLNSSRTAKGVGIYLDGKVTVANLKTGRYVYNGKDIAYTTECRPSTKYIYANIETNILDNNITNSSMSVSRLKELVRTIQRGHDLPKSTILAVIGFCMQSALAGVVNHRSHIWVTGSTGTGKGNMLMHTIGGILAPLAKKYTEATAEGINQGDTTNISDAMVYLIDELGTDTRTKANRKTGLIMLARNSATSDDESVSARGTRDLRGREFSSTRVIGATSTTSSLQDMQDVSRFWELRLNKGLKLRTSGEFKEYIDFMNFISPYFLNTAIKSAGNFKETLVIVSSKLHEKYKFNRDLSHKIQVIQHIVTGVVIMYQVVTKLGLDKVLDKICDEMHNWIEGMIAHQYNVATNKLLVSKDIISSIVLDSSGYAGQLVDILKSEVDKENFYKNWGIWISQREPIKLCIEKKNFRLDRLLENRSLCKTLVNNCEERLHNEASLCHTSDIINFNDQVTNSVTNKRQRCISILIGDKIEKDN